MPPLPPISSASSQVPAACATCPLVPTSRVLCPVLSCVVETNGEAATRVYGEAATRACRVSCVPTRPHAISRASRPYRPSTSWLRLEAQTRGSDSRHASPQAYARAASPYATYAAYAANPRLCHPRPHALPHLGCTPHVRTPAVPRHTAFAIIISLYYRATTRRGEAEGRSRVAARGIAT
jgi:hypothetical protein